MENMDSTTHYHVFISYRGVDYDFAKPIFEFLTQNGLSVFLAPDTLREKGKSDYTSVIMNAITNSDHMIVCASKKKYLDPNNDENEWVKTEWNKFISLAIDRANAGKKVGNLVLITSHFFPKEYTEEYFSGKQNFVLSNYREEILYYVRPLLTNASSEDDYKNRSYLPFHPDVVITNMTDITSNAPIIMAERGEVKNGFDDSAYFERPYNPKHEEGETVGEHLRRMVEQNNVTIITGTYGMGKSRAVYEYLKREANRSDSTFKRVVTLRNQDSLSCSFGDLKEYMESILEPDTAHELIVYIDNLHNKKDINGKSGLSEWADIFRVVREHKAHIIVSCLDTPTKEEQSILVDINPAVITIPEVDRAKTYLACRTKWHAKQYSPIIGNYVDGMENFKRLVKKRPLEEGELVLLCVYILINHYFRSQGKERAFLENVYLLAGHAIPQKCGLFGYKDRGATIYSGFFGNSAKNIPAKKEYNFDRALQNLCKRNILKEENNQYILYDEIFAEKFAETLCSHSYMNDPKLTEEGKALRRVCSELVIKREDLLYQQELWLTQLIIYLEKEKPEFYARTITRASLQNTRQIARFVKQLFDKQFFELDDSKKVTRIKEKYRTIENEIKHVIGIILSRCYDKQHWKEDLLQYEAAGITIQDDVNIIGELLRMAADERTNREFKQSILSFMDDHMGLDKAKLDNLAKENIRIAVTYESVREEINEPSLLLILKLFKEKFNDVHKEYRKRTESDDFDDFLFHEDTYDSEESDNSLQRTEAKHLVRAFKNWSKYVCLKVDSPDSLQKLIIFLSEEEAREYLASINEVMYKVRTLLGPGFETLECTFMSDYSLAAIAQKIHVNYPLCYIDWYKKCIEILNIARDRVYILDSKSSYKGFIIHAAYINGIKINMGALKEVETLEDAFDMIDELKRIKLLDDKDFGIDSFYATCMYEAFNKIENYKKNDAIDKIDDAFATAKEYVDSRYEALQEIGGKIKLYNNLLLHTPTFAKAIELIESDFLKREYTIDTINNFFVRARKEYRRLYKTDNVQKRKFILKQILDKASWLQSKEAYKLDDISFVILDSIKLTEDIEGVETEQLKKLLDDLRKNQTSKPANKIKKSKEWQISFSKKIPEEPDKQQKRLEFIKKQLEKALRRLEALQKYFVDASTKALIVEKDGKIKEEIILFSSDSISNLMSSFGYFTNPKMEWDEDISQLINDIRELLTGLIINARIDDYFKPQLYFYDQARLFCLSDLNHIQKWEFIEHAIDRLVECNAPFIGSDERNTDQKNLLENVISSLPFDEALELVTRAKDKAKTEIYRELYTPKAIKMLCNKLRKDLPADDEDAMNILVQRITKINALISDPEITLVFDADNSKLISSINSYIRGKENDHETDRCFPFFPEDIKINVPLQLCNIRYFVLQILTIQDTNRLSNLIDISYLVSQQSSLAKDVVYDLIMRNYVAAYKRTCDWLKKRQIIGYRQFEPVYFDRFIEPYILKKQKGELKKITTALRNAQDKALETYRKSFFNHKKTTPSIFAQSEIKTIVDLIYEKRYVDLSFFVKALIQIPRKVRQSEFEKIITWYLSEHKTCQYILGNRNGHKDYVPPYFCDFVQAYITSRIKPDFETISADLNKAQDAIRSRNNGRTNS